MSEPTSPDEQFVLVPDRSNPGYILCYCLFCNRLVAASRDEKIFEITQRSHICKQMQDS
jgi:hypothetical protein